MNSHCVQALKVCCSLFLPFNFSILILFPITYTFCITNFITFKILVCSSQYLLFQNTPKVSLHGTLQYLSFYNAKRLAKNDVSILFLLSTLNLHWPLAKYFWRYNSSIHLSSKINKRYSGRGVTLMKLLSPKHLAWAKAIISKHQDITLLVLRAVLFWM